MAFTPEVQVVAPEPRGLRYGLLQAANGPYDLPLHGAAGGITYDPVSCGNAHTYPSVCHGGIHLGKEFDPGDDWIIGDPFTIYSSIVCGSVGSTEDTLKAKVLRRINNGEQTQIEAHLAANLAAAATPIVATDPLTLAGVVGELEQWLYGNGGIDYGNVGYIHAPVRMASYASDESLIVVDGAVMRTHMGSIWVFGGGYPDDGTIYISGQVTVWCSPDIQVTPADQGLDKITNEFKMLAERDCAVAFDCVAASISYDWITAS